jgi:hypothetical protein
MARETDMELKKTMMAMCMQEVGRMMIGMDRERKHLQVVASMSDLS